MFGDHPLTYLVFLTVANESKKVKMKENIKNDFYSNLFSFFMNFGERFLTESFINQYKENQSAPLLNDGRPEFSKWLDYYYYYTLGTCAFRSGWTYGIRSQMARPFFQNMHDLYKQNDMPFECVI